MLLLIQKKITDAIIKANKTVAKYEEGDIVRKVKEKRRFEKGYTGIWSEEKFKIIKVRKTFPVTYEISKLDSGRREKGFYYEKQLQLVD